MCDHEDYYREFLKAAQEDLDALTDEQREEASSVMYLPVPLVLLEDGKVIGIIHPKD